ncbi:MAG: LPS export ABC transporter periplasmic protein LptC [Woeseiaceae bacterium]|nr:LPS export ABC transporter periplasmic protein LptC [Woeseiaceae bacterium]
MTPREIVVVIVLAAGAVWTWYLSQSSDDEESATPSFDASQRGYYLRAARILGTGPDGSLLYELQAREAEQLGQDRIAFTDVHLDYSPQSDVPWSVNADSATIHTDEPVVLLEGQVRAISSEGFSGNDTEIRTEYLEVYPEEFLAETDDRVQIRIGERSLTATGMLASLQDNQIKLKSNVRGKFAP